LPSFLPPTDLGRLAPLALGAAPLMQVAGASTAACDGGSSFGASGAGGITAHASSAFGAGGVCDCGGGGASCVARGVCVGAARGPGRFSSTISAMVVESKPDVELPTAPFWLRYVNFERLLVWRLPLQPPAVYGPRPPCAVRSRSSPLVQLRAARRPSALSLPSATYGPQLPRAAGSGSSASQAGGCGIDGGTQWPQQRRRKRRRWRRQRRRHRQRMRRMRRRQRRLRHTRRMRRRHWRPKPLFLYHQRDGR